MERRVYRFVEEASQRLSNHQIFNDHDNLIGLLQQSVDLFLSCPHYSAYLTTPQDFISLPTEIIHNVVDVAAESWERKKRSLQLLQKIEGPWGEFAQRASDICSSVLWFGSSGFNSREKFDQKCSFEEARSRFISRAEICEKVNVDQLRAVASNLYESIGFTNVPDIPKDILARLGTRFSTVVWTSFSIEEEGKPAKNSLKPEVIDFFKRQLRSEHIGTLRIAAAGFAQGELDNLLLKFVKSPNFQSLRLYNVRSMDHRGHWRQPTGGYPIPFELITGAYEQWRSREFFHVENQDNFGSVSQETFQKLQNYVRSEFDHPRRKTVSVREFHSSIYSAEMRLESSMRPAPFLKLEFIGMKTMDSGALGGYIAH